MRATTHAGGPLERPGTVPFGRPGYSADEVRRTLAVVPEIVRCRRDRAILLVLVLIGRRRPEVIGLRAGDLKVEARRFLHYRGTRGKRGATRPDCPSSGTRRPSSAGMQGRRSKPCRLLRPFESRPDDRPPAAARGRDGPDVAATIGG